MGLNGGYSLEVESISDNGDIVFYDHSDPDHGNTENTIYLKGDADTDGSIRLIVDSGDELGHIEMRANGVWNDTSFRFSAGSIELGRDLKIEAAASFIETFNEAIADEHQRALIPHIPFTDAGTTFPHTPVLGILQTDTTYSTAVSETISTTIGILFTADHARFVQSIIHEVGTIGASSSVEYSVYSGTDNTGILISRKTLPASDLIADTALTVTFASDIGLNDTGDFYFELVSDTAFSLKTDSSGNPLTIINEQHLDTIDLIAENLVYNNDHDYILANDLNPVYENQI